MKRIFLLILFMLTYVSVFAGSATDRQEQSIYNFYGPNAGFENGIKDCTVSSAIKNWSTTEHLGTKSLKCTFDTAADYCELKLVTNPGAALNAQYAFYYKTTSSTVKAQVVDGSGNVVREINPLPANTGFTESVLDFVAAASTSYKLRFTETSGASIIYVDTVSMTKNLNVGTVAQAEFVGSITFGADCAFTATGTSYTDFGADSSCTTTTVGDVSAITGILPGVNILNPKSGTYSIVAYGNVGTGNTTNRTFFRFFDGTNSFGDNQYQNTTAAYGVYSAINGSFEYTTAPSSLSIKIQSKILTSGSSYLGDSQGLKIDVYRNPSSSNKVVRAESANQFAGVTITDSPSGSSPVCGNGSYATCTDTDLTSAYKTHHGNAVITTTAGDAGFKMPSLEPGSYLVLASGGPMRSGCYADWRITDGTTNGPNHTVYYGSTDITIPMIMAEFEYSSIQTNIEFKVQAKGVSCAPYIDTYQGAGAGVKHFTMVLIPLSPQVSTPLIINSVGTTYKGQTKLESAIISGATLASGCTSSPCTLYSNTGGISSVSRNSAGSYSVNFKSGTFSQPPTCTCSGRGLTYITTCRVQPATKDLVYALTNKVSDSADTDEIVSIICHGTK